MLVSQVIRRALLLLNAIDAASPVPALDAQDAIIALNSMMTNWESNGLAFGWANVSAVDDTLPIPDEDENTVTYNLAVNIAPMYAIPAAMPGVADMARSFLSETRRRRLVEMPLRLIVETPCSSSGRGFNINAMITDDY